MDEVRLPPRMEVYILESEDLDNIKDSDSFVDAHKINCRIIESLMK